MPGIIGRKVGMTSIYSAEGKATPCTVIEAGPCVVTQVKTQDRDGYEAIQLGFGERKEKNTPNALKGHFKKANTTPKATLAEFKGFDGLNLGDVVDATIFEEGEYVGISGTSKGKGFQGACSYPARVFKGMRMAGQMGNKTVVVENLVVLKVLADKNLIVVKGSIPGAKGSTVTIEK